MLVYSIHPGDYLNLLGQLCKFARGFAVKTKPIVSLVCLDKFGEMPGVISQVVPLKTGGFVQGLTVTY